MPNIFDDCPERKTCDPMSNSYGEKIIKFGKIYDLKIFNGRMKRDMIGNFTHMNKNKGKSTFVYGL